MTKNFAQLIGSLAAVLKAAPEDKIADLRDSLEHAGAVEVPDMWNKPRGEHSAPSRAEIVTGPAEHMEGANAGRMIGRYSDGAPQAGLTELYARFEGILSDFGKSMTADFNKKLGALADIVTEHNKSFATLKGVIDAAATDATAKAAEPDELTFFGKAQIKLAKAQKAFRKAEMEEDEEGREERKARLTEIADVLKSVLKLISKADEEEKHGDEEVEKALATMKALQSKVSVALGVINKAEEDEKKEEAEKARAAAEATAKAEVEKAAAGGTETITPAAKAENEEKEEEKDDTAKAKFAQQVAAEVQKALEGKTVIPGTMDEVFALLQGVSKSLATPPDMSGGTAVIKGNDAGARLEAAIEAGTLSGPETVRGQDLLSRQAAVAAGHYDLARFKEDVARSPQNVREIFNAA